MPSSGASGEQRGGESTGTSSSESSSSLDSGESSAIQGNNYGQQGGEETDDDRKGQINTLNELSSPPGGSTIGGGFVRPVSTTIYHVPDSSQYASQSFRFPNFRPQQVYVHDFTQPGSGRVTSIFETPSSAAGVQREGDDRTVGEQSQNVQSWRAFYNQPQKAPKIIDNYPPENDSEEEAERQFLVPSSQPPHLEQQIITSGPPTTAECSTAETQPFTLTSSASASSSSPVATDKPEEKIRFRVGKLKLYDFSFHS